MGTHWSMGRLGGCRALPVGTSQSVLLASPPRGLGIVRAQAPRPEDFPWGVDPPADSSRLLRGTRDAWGRDQPRYATGRFGLLTLAAEQREAMRTYTHFTAVGFGFVIGVFPGVYGFPKAVLLSVLLAAAGGAVHWVAARSCIQVDSGDLAGFGDAGVPVCSLDARLSRRQGRAAHGSAERETLDSER